ncbi:NnrS multi-domain protein [Streptomyces sp. NPDC049837]|uniref:NnrS multi-domain protein n=1 Tax=Streptomyces sp. NPDC049837 TaxID=3155277 RepID=UPI0034196704
MRYDQRVLALVEVRGPSRDQDEAAECFGQRGWPVLGRWPCGEGPTAGVLRARADSSVFLVEVRFFGARNARTGQAAAWRVEALARAVKLEMYVRRTELVNRDREHLPHWRVLTTGHRPVLPAAPRPREEVAAFRKRRNRVRVRESGGRYDTGEFASGTPSEARRLARVGLEPGSPDRRHVDARAKDGRWRADGALDREEQVERSLFRMFSWLGLMTFAVVVARAAQGVATVLWSVLALVFLTAALRVSGRISTHHRRQTRIACLVAAGFFVAIGTGPLSGASVTSTQALVMLATVFTVSGCYLLVRQWTWGEWLTWGVPLVASLVISGVVASGSVLHALYADALSLTPDDLEVSGMWQATSAIKLLSFLALVLLAPAAWGILKHFHRIRPRDGSNVIVYVLLLILVLTGVGSLAVDSAERAADATMAAARERGTPPGYFGVRPEWTCVEPAVPVAELPSEGGSLDPAERHPYLLISVAGGSAVLWNDSGTGKAGPMKIPADKVRLIPAGSPAMDCRRAA